MERTAYKFVGMGWGASERTKLCIHCKCYCPKEDMTTIETVEHSNDSMSDCYDADICNACYEEVCEDD